MKDAWGLLGPLAMEHTRRTRSLGLDGVVRTFNDLAVPGQGGVWFAMPVALACVGIRVARETGQSALRVTNAIEALACWISFEKTAWASDRRLRGGTKMRSRGLEDLHYSEVSHPGFYVTQPMRQYTRQPLVAWGLVYGGPSRFNDFELTPAGEGLVTDLVGDRRAGYHGLQKALAAWVRGDQRLTGGFLDGVFEGLSPLQAPPPKVRSRLRNLMTLEHGDPRGAQRRRRLLGWWDAVRESAEKAQEPFERHYLEAAHRQDLHAGRLFFLARQAALAHLDQVESHLASLAAPRWMPSRHHFSGVMGASAARLKAAATSFLAFGHDPTQGREATGFARLCALDDPVEATLQLIARDGRVLMRQGNGVIPGAAFRAGEAEISEEDADSNGIWKWGEGISERIPNGCFLNLDLHGELDRELGGQ